MTMNTTMAEAKSKRNATATQHQAHGLNDYGSIGEARVALQNSGLGETALDHAHQMDMAGWMWRNDASPEDAAIAFGLRPLLQ